MQVGKYMYMVGHHCYVCVHQSQELRLCLALFYLLPLKSRGSTLFFNLN